MTSSAYNGPGFIDPGCPWQNGFLESFHCNLRDELLDREVFVSVAEAQSCLETYQHWYSEGRPHSTLHYVSPAAFAKSWRQAQQKQEAIEPPVQPKDLHFNQKTYIARGTYNGGRSLGQEF